MNYHSESRQTVLEHLQSGPAGLTSEEAAARRQRFGKNVLKEKKKRSALGRFADQFKDAMILILLAAAAVSFVTAWADGQPREFFEPVLILLIVVLNAILGVIQESKAEKALDALKNLSAPHARVIRDGEDQIIPAAELVPGDVIRLEAGAFIPADCRLLRTVCLKCDESALTGESLPAEKDADAAIPEAAPLGDRATMVYTGCAVSYGNGIAVVTATGMKTEIGRIADLLDNEEDAATPLQQKLSRLGKTLGFLALAACAVVFLVGFFSGIPVMEIFMTAVSLAVSAIPEGLPAIVTIVLSIGVQRMVKKNAVIRRLPAVETLGSASVICSDKTGTLTQNRMTLTHIWPAGSDTVETASDHNSEAARALLRWAALCCDGHIRFQGEEVRHIGDPTETAIVLAAHHNDLPREMLNRQFPRVAELPFDSDRKLMTTVHDCGEKLLVIVKGAFDVMACRCAAGDLEAARQINEELSRDALRVLAVGIRELDALPEDITPEELETDLTFLGLLGMIDPPRKEAKAAVSLCRRAGIRPVMITGDHVATASAIAKELGILSGASGAITGAQLDTMTDAELDARVEHIGVYARVSPENKIRIVKAWQRKGQVVAMTGDGVNDAPALKAADIGCAMGITGTDTAKGAADMTLADDNFATIVDAVREGRGIYANIRKVVGFLLGTNIGEVVAVFLAMVLWRKTPLLSLQLLLINLVTDSLPAIALGMEPVETDIMEQPPKPREEGLFANGFGLRTVLQGLMFGTLSLIAFRLGWKQTGVLAGGQTMAFTVLALSQVVQAFNMRSHHSLFRIGIFSNSRLNWAAFSSVALVALVLFTPAAALFGLIALPPLLYLAALGLILVPLLVMETGKFIASKKTRCH